MISAIISQNKQVRKCTIEQVVTRTYHPSVVMDNLCNRDCHDSGSIYVRCKTLASSLVGLIRARQLHHTRAHLSRRVAQGHL
jgi:hypothetical protein